MPQDPIVRHFKRADELLAKLKEGCASSGEKTELRTLLDQCHRNKKLKSKRPPKNANLTLIQSLAWKSNLVREENYKQNIERFIYAINNSSDVVTINLPESDKLTLKEAHIFQLVTDHANLEIINPLLSLYAGEPENDDMQSFLQFMRDCVAAMEKIREAIYEEMKSKNVDIFSLDPVKNAKAGSKKIAADLISSEYGHTGLVVDGKAAEVRTHTSKTPIDKLKLGTASRAKLFQIDITKIIRPEWREHIKKLFETDEENFGDKIMKQFRPILVATVEQNRKFTYRGLSAIWFFLLAMLDCIISIFHKFVHICTPPIVHNGDVEVCKKTLCSGWAAMMLTKALKLCNIILRDKLRENSDELPIALQRQLDTPYFSFFCELFPDRRLLESVTPGYLFERLQAKGIILPISMDIVKKTVQDR
ncbi:MAG: hypothetical protein LBF26_01120 [Puniceicoccales bacterium]|jgi:hypothetical protein|nr:hypothetical protein [Puniceicoccales bacterium]